MLSPNVMTVGDLFAEAYSNIKKADSFAYAGMNTFVGKLSPDPDWLEPVRTRISMLSNVCATWQQQKPNIWSQILLPFANYYTTFSGFAEAAKDFGDDKDAWLEALDQLKQELTTAKSATEVAEGQFEMRIKNIKNVESLLETSINDAWAALAEEEKQMVELASEITHLQDQVDQLQDSITNAEISSGKSYIQTAVKISYTLVSTAGAEIPYLSIAGLVFTVGKLAYDMIVTDKEISETIDKIIDLRVEVTEEAQAAAATKAVIHLINNLDKSLLSIQSQLPHFRDMWSTERDKINEAISAINSGADPRYYFDLQTMPSAVQTWKTLADYIPKLTQTPEQGKPITLSTSKDN